MRDDSIKPVLFSDLDPSDPFFNSLRASYHDFDTWFMKKAKNEERAFVTYDEGNALVAMMYIKPEEGADYDVTPPLTGRRLKIGTLKVDSTHHTMLGRRYLALALRSFAADDYSYAYVTLFSGTAQTCGLERLLSQYGFTRYGDKGNESVMIKFRPQTGSGNPYIDFPFISLGSGNDWILSIQPEYHIRMFGETDLRSEWGIPIPDEHSINSIEKVYLSGSDNAQSVQAGDRMLIYRTGDSQGSAYYRAVASSVCTVLETRHIDSFSSEQAFLDYTSGKSVFSIDELHTFWTRRRYPWLISLLYNMPFKRYPIRGSMLEAGLIPEGRIVCEPIPRNHLCEIAKLGGVNESAFIN